MATSIPRRPLKDPPSQQPRILRVLILTIELVVVLGAATWTGVQSFGSPGQPAQHHMPFAMVHIEPEANKPVRTQVRNARPCVRRNAWEHVFPTPYLGEVYVQMSASPHATVPADLTLTWGPWRWQHLVPIQPGQVRFGLGGTLLLYSKLYTTGRTGINPPIMLHSDVPVCAHFGSALGPSPAPATVINANSGWVHWQQQMRDSATTKNLELPVRV